MVVLTLFQAIGASGRAALLSLAAAGLRTAAAAPGPAADLGFDGVIASRALADAAACAVGTPAPRLGWTAPDLRAGPAPGGNDHGRGGRKVADERSVTPPWPRRHPSAPRRRCDACRRARRTRSGSSRSAVSTIRRAWHPSSVATGQTPDGRDLADGRIRGEHPALETETAGPVDGEVAHHADDICFSRIDIGPAPSRREGAA